MIKKWLCPFFLGLLLCQLVSAQQNSTYAQNKGDVLMPYLSYAVHRPGGDLADRFGNNFSLGLGLDWMTAKSNWIFGLNANFLFGNSVKSDVLAGLRTDAGFIIGNNRLPADITLRQRGWLLHAEFGKHFPLNAENPRSGIRITLSPGLFQHRIRIQDDPQQAVPQLLGDYKKGYDRLTNGFSITEFIGYQLLSENKRINFFLGLEFTQAFTQNRRDFDFVTRSKDEVRRMELLSGIRLGWIIPFYVGSGGGDIYY
ncbi:MAG: hypothetical protein HRU41_22360 [Saprospiraceae bacterium]|nr:hypothetical protein [Saprospiraceae bacterium]